MSRLTDEIAKAEAGIKLARLRLAVLTAQESLNGEMRDMTEAERIGFEEQYGKGAFKIGDFIIREVSDFEPSAPELGRMCREIERRSRQTYSPEDDGV